MYDKLTPRFSPVNYSDNPDQEDKTILNDGNLKLIDFNIDNDIQLINRQDFPCDNEFNNIDSSIPQNPYAIITLDRRSFIKNANSYTEELFLYKLEEMKDRSIFQLISAESSNELQTIITNDFNLENINKSIKLKGRKPDGNKIDLIAKVINDNTNNEVILFLQEEKIFSPAKIVEKTNDFTTDFTYGLGKKIFLSENNVKEDFKDTIERLDYQDYVAKDHFTINNKVTKNVPENDFGVLFHIDDEYKIVDVSPSITKILGYEKDELNNCYLTTKMLVDDIISFQNFLENILNTEVENHSLELSLLNKNGDYIPFELKGYKNQTGVKRTMVLYAYEISRWKNLEKELKAVKSEMTKLVEGKVIEFRNLNEKLNREVEWRKEVEKELREKEERLELAFEISDYGLWDFNFTNGQIYFNDNFASILDMNFKNHSFYWEDFEKMIFESDKLMFNEAFENHSSMLTQMFEVEHRIVTKNNGIKWVLTRGKVVQRDDESKPLRFIGKLEDISPRKKNEENMQSALIKGKELNELKSKFVSMLSHEIRNPLSQILSSSEILEMFINEMSENERLEIIHKIQKSVDKLTEILNDAVNIDNSEILDKEIQLSEFNVVEFCERQIDDLKIQFEKTALIHLEANFDDPVITSDMNSMQQIVTNLLSNSIKYTADNKNIYIRINRNEKSLVLTFQDEGIGIDYFDHPKIFEPFYKGRNSENKAGSGLGLTLVKKAVVSLKGNIEFNSRPDVGTTFTVTIPIK